MLALTSIFLEAKPLVYHEAVDFGCERMCGSVGLLAFRW